LTVRRELSVETLLTLARVAENRKVAFFDDQQGAAVLKHGILSRYLPIYASKTGSTSIGNRVAYLDAYAGAGAYEDGVPGSPALAAKTAEVLTFRQIECFMIEQDGATFEALSRNLAGAESCTILRGSVEELLDGVLARVEDCPLFAFFDPFGLLLPLGTLQRVLDRQQSTEVLLTFSLPGLRRNAGHLTSTSTDPTYLRARATILAKVDAALGGNWWREVWMSETEDRTYRIFEGWRDRIAGRMDNTGGGWGWWTVPVADSWGATPVYFLLLLTKHRDGLWHFHQALSSAREEYYEFTHRGELVLEPLAQREASWIAGIKANLERLLEDTSSFTTREKMNNVFGEFLGLAREKHVRVAVRALYAEGKITWNGKVSKGQAEFPDQRITRVP